MSEHKGTCFCGAIEVTVNGAPAAMGYCHCDSCRHWSWDGGGYPHGLAGEEIPLEARIVAVADAWDAMVSDRPYRPALRREAALAEVARCRGTQFDPQVAGALLELHEQRLTA